MSFVSKLKAEYTGKPVLVYLRNGVKLSGSINLFDVQDDCLEIERETIKQLVHNDAIATVMPDDESVRAILAGAR